MTPLKEQEIRKLLTPRETITAPAELAARIKAEIPDRITAAGDAAVPAEGRGVSRWLALAASVAVLAGGSLLAYRLLSERPLAPDSVVAVQPAAEREPVPSISEESLPAQSRAPARSAAEGTYRGASPVLEDEAQAPNALIVEQKLADLRDARSVAGTLEAGGERSAAAAEGELARRPQAPAAGREDLQARQEETRRELDTRSRELEYRLKERRSQQAGARQPGSRADAARPAEAPAGVPADEGRLRALGYLAESAPPAPPERFEEMIVVTGEAEKIDVSAATPSLASPAAPPPSTGGTAEPNAAAFGDVFFRGHGTNPFIDTEDDALSTFGLDVDTGSYTVARRYLRDGHLPPPDAVRVEEFINYFDYRDPAPTEAEFAIHAEGAPSLFGHGERYYLLRFNLHGREVDDRDRPPALLTFVVDVSGSMARENRLGLVKDALALLLENLRDDDRIALVVYGSRGRVLLEPTGDRRAIRRAIDELRPEGSTNAEEGLRLAYELAARHRRPGTINRVLLCSDGVANVGRTSADSILERIRHDAERGVELTTVGFGMGNYNDVLMERLADTGNGRYAYVDSLDEARRIFVEDLTGTLQTIAAEARAQVEFNPATVARYRLLGYENRDIADHRFRDDTVDAGEIGAGHTVTALYEVKLHKKPRRGDRIATLHLRFASIAGREMVELERSVTGADFVKSWERASPALRLTSLVAEFAEVLKQTHWARDSDLDEVLRRAQQVSADYAGDRDVADFVSLVARAAAVQDIARRER